MLRILSHNTFWFQGHPFEGDHPGAADPTVLAELLAIYRQIHPDVLCLQEIQSNEVASGLAAGLNRPALYAPGVTLTQYGGCVIGAGVEACAPPQKVSLPPQRICQRVRWSGSTTTLGLLNLHAPSDRQLGASSAERRLAEFQSWLDQPDRPDVVCGDFNERPGRAVSQLLNRHGYVDTAEATRNGDRCSSIGGKRSDFIWISAGLSSRLIGYDAIKPRDFLSHAPGKSFQSDHLPLWIDLAIDV